MTKKPHRVPGDFLEIDLDDGRYMYARVLPSTIAFYEGAYTSKQDIADVVVSPIIFNIWVVDYAITDGVWPVIGHIPLSDALLEETLFFKKDTISGKLTIYKDSTGEEWPATAEECRRLECAAVWKPEHVVDRLRDHLADRKNKWVESLQP